MGGGGGGVGGFLCIDDLEDHKYPEIVAREMRRSVFRMGNISLKLRNSSAQQISSFFSRPACCKNPRNNSDNQNER